MAEPISQPVGKDAEMLREFLAERDIACPGCKYNLRRLRSDKCPECGQPLRLQVGLAEPMTRVFITGLIGVSAGAGFSALLLCYWAFRWNSGGGGPAKFLLIVAGGFLVEGAATAAWIWGRTRLHRLCPVMRWGLVAGCWLLTILNFVVFTAEVR